MSLIKLLGSLRGGRQAATAKVPSKANTQWISNPWHAVAVVPGPRSCALARDEGGVRYLSKEAPPLPLKDCDFATCTCRYRHYNDRRTSPRRAADVWSNRVAWAGRERRVAGRRSTDGP